MAGASTVAFRNLIDRPGPPSGSARLAEEGALSPEAFTWRVDIHHQGHIRPFVLPSTGAASGAFTIPATGETAAGWYRVHLTVRDSAGLTDSVFVDVVPRHPSVGVR